MVGREKALWLVAVTVVRACGVWHRPTSGLEAYSKRKGGMTMRWSARLGLALVVLAAGLMGVAVPAQADTFVLTSCHISGSSCEGGSVSDANAFGSVTLSLSGTTATVD